MRKPSKESVRSRGIFSGSPARGQLLRHGFFETLLALSIQLERVDLRPHPPAGGLDVHLLENGWRPSMTSPARTASPSFLTVIYGWVGAATTVIL